MRLKILALLICFLNLLYSIPLASQEIENRKIKLAEALQVIEGQFDLKFSYIDENVKDVTIIIPALDQHIQNIITEIENQTSLVFEKLNANSYSISKKIYWEACGKIVDKSTNQEIPGATIECINTNEAVVSDINGSFTFSRMRADYMLKVRYIGYEEYIINSESLFQKPCTIIYLDQKTQVLNEIVVQQFLTSGLNKQKDGNITINPEYFGILPGLTDPDILHTIQALPGIESVNETVSDINIRGGTHDQNLILWNNIKMYQSGHFFGLISAFNPYLTEKVSVIKNGTSTSYGDGVSGIIDMHSFNTIQSDFNGGIGLNLISGDFYAHIPIGEKFGAQISVRRSITDFLKTPTYKQFYDRTFQNSKITNIESEEVEYNINRNEDFFFYDTSLKLFYDLNEKHKFRGNVLLMNNNLKYEETLNDEPDPETKQSTLKQRNLGFGLTVESTWTEKFSTELQTYYTNYDLEAVNFTLLADQRLITNNEVLETGAKILTNYKLSDHFDFVNGYQYNETGIVNLEDVNNPEFRRRIKEVVRNHAIFSEVKYHSPSKKTFARIGGRLNYIENFNKYIPEPRVSVNQNLGGNFNMELLAEMKNQVTNQIIDLQRDFLGVEKRRWTLANNKDLPVTQSKQVSLGFNFNKKSFYAAIEGFYKKVDGITTSNQGFQNQNQFPRTSGSYRVNGMELLINKKTSKYSTWLSYTLSENEYTFKELKPGNFPNNLDIRHSISFAGTYTINKLRLAMGVNWRTGKPYTRPVEGNEVTVTNTDNLINYQTPNSSNLDNYFRVDFSSIYNFRIGDNSRATAGIAILNLLNRKNLLDIYYRLTDPEDTEVQQVENISLGITPNVSFRVFF